MENKKNKFGPFVILFGAIWMGLLASDIDYDNLRRVDIVKLSGIGLFAVVGVFVMIKWFRDKNKA